METIKNEDIEEEKKKAACFPGFGIFCAIMSSLMYSCSSIIVKMVDLNPAQLGLSRCIVQFLILLPIIQGKHKTVDITGFAGVRLLLWLRGFSGSLAMMFLYFSISKLSVGNAVTITYLKIILVPFTAWLFLKEEIAILDIIFAVVSLCGVFLIAKPTFLFPNQDAKDVTSLIGVIYALLSALLVSLTICTVRKLGRVTYPLLNVLYYSFCGSLTTFTVLAISGEFRFPCWNDLPFVFSLGCIGVIGQTFLTFALKTEKAGTVSVLGSINIILVYVAQIAFFEDIPSVLSLVGTALIVLCSIGIGIRKILDEKRKSKKKNKQ